MFKWIKTADQWELKLSQYVSELPQDASRYMEAAEMCKRQAEEMAGGNQDVLHELAKVAPFSIRWVDTSTKDGREEAMYHLDLYCEELMTVLEATDTSVRKLRGAKRLLADSMNVL